MDGYFDNAATTYRKPEGMYEHISDYMLSYGASIGRGGYTASMQGGKILIDTRLKLLALMNAPQTRTVVFTPTATIALNTIIFGLNFECGDIIYISHFEHNAILRPLFHLEKIMGIKLKFLPMCADDKHTFDLTKIEEEFALSRPKVVIVSHISNVLGTIAPIEEITLLSKKYAAVTIVDGAQACGVVDCNLTNVDFYVFAGHKTLLSPTGIGGFICNKNTTLRPLILGGTGIDSANREMPKTVPERFEGGTTNLMAALGLNYSLQWILKNKDFIKRAEQENLEKLFEILKKYSFLRIISPYPKVSSIIACRADGFTSDEFGRILANNNIAVRTGLHCAPETHKYLNSFPEGLIRFSISCFTVARDFNLLEQALEKISLEV